MSKKLKKGWDIYFLFFPPYVKCTMYAVLAHASLNARLTRHFFVVVFVFVN